MALGKPKLCTKFEVANFSCCKNIKGNRKNLGSPLDQGHAHFSSAWDFTMGIGKPYQSANFEVATFSRCRNIKGEPQILGSYPSLGPRLLFLWALHQTTKRHTLTPNLVEQSVWRMWQWRCFDTIRRREKSTRESPLKNRVVYNTTSLLRRRDTAFWINILMCRKWSYFKILSVE